MQRFVSGITESVNEQLQEIDLGRNDVLQQVAEAIKVLESAFCRLKEFIIGYRFRDEAEEIRFFKELKPKLYSKLLYYHKIHSINMRCPAGSNEVKKEYLHDKLKRINDFFLRNIDFYEYYRSGSTHLDNYCFLRGKPDIRLNVDSFCFELDPRFSTGFDFKVAKIMANDMLTIYLNTELERLNAKSNSAGMGYDFTRSKHTWTGSKTDLVECIYGFYVEGSIDNGNMDIKEYADYFSNMLNIDLKDIYRIYLNIRNRKGSRTSYLDSMRDKLNRKMDDDDSR